MSPNKRKNKSDVLKYNPMSQIKSKMKKIMLKKEKEKKLEKVCLCVCVCLNYMISAGNASSSTDNLELS